MSATPRSQPLPSSAASEFFSWWGEELRGWLRALSSRRAAERWGPHADIIIVKDGLLLGPERTGPCRIEDVRRGSADLPVGLPRSVSVMLGQGRFLKRKLAESRVPLERAQTMAEFDVEAQTPFRLDEVYMLFAEPVPEGRDMHYYLVRRDILDPVLDALRDGRRKLERLTFDDEGIGRAAGGFAIAGLNGGRSVTRTAARHMFGIVCLLCVVLTGYNVSTALASALSSVDSRIDSVEPEAKDAREAFRERAALLGRIEAARTEQDARVPMARLLEELTLILPDTTYLVGVSMRSDKVKVTGFSKDAAALIPLIDRSRFFGDPRFVSAVVNVPDRNGEQFELEAEIEHVR